METLTPAPSGRTFAGGRFTSPRLGLALLETNGSAVYSFSSNLGTNVVVHTLARDPNGRLLVGGKFVTGPDCNIVRLTSSGALDPSSSYPMSAEGEVRSIALDPDNRILVAGDFTGFVGWPCAGLVRLKSTGELDTGFNPAAGAWLGKPVLAIRDDGGILVGGTCTNGRPLLCLMGGEALPAPPSVSIEPSQQRVTVGQTAILKSLVTSARFPFSGRWTLNGTNVLTITGPVLTLTNATLEQAGSYVFSATNDFGTGSSTATVEVPALSASVGKLDTSYNTGTRPQVMDGIFTLALQPDGGAIIGGGFGSFNGVARTNVARVDATGNIDTGFNTGTLAYGSYPDWVYGFARQNDGKLLVVGSFNRHLFRCEPTGSLDSPFASSYATTLYAVALQPDGRVLVGTTSGIRRLTATGSSPAQRRVHVGAQKANSYQFAVEIMGVCRQLIVGVVSEILFRKPAEAGGAVCPVAGSVEPVTGISKTGNCFLPQPVKRIIFPGVGAVCHRVKQRFRKIRPAASLAQSILKARQHQ